MNVTFDGHGHSSGTNLRYTNTMLESDWNWDTFKYSQDLGGNNYYGVLNAQSSNEDNCYIVDDPHPGGNRQHVLRVRHKSGKGGPGAIWRGDILGNDGSGTYNGKVALGGGGYDEIYLAFDMYLPSSNGNSNGGDPCALQQKNFGLMTPGLLLATHGSEQAVVHGDTGYSMRLQMYSQQAYGGYHGNFSGSTTYYDANAVQVPNWYDTVDPTTNRDNSPNQYHFAQDVWHTVELHMVVNSADGSTGESGSDLYDGYSEAWVNGVLLQTRTNHQWRYVNTLKIDGVSLFDYYGGNISDPRNTFPIDTYTYYDNIRVSESQITL
jgi:hypothetical protein